ncbi:hypothetical protein [Micromonospora humidisoli]|uniref:Sigma-70, region 4 n=1 Tax=Micromonospora humidisoli TaxID=2807622 RepID=A0ABS2JAK4_9ACTN|nr:hypothetical protein [Micromonospora humidisoli]MBM7083592.1 hypothetical protein [Micromonospora humidisoli]
MDLTDLAARLTATTHLPPLEQYAALRDLGPEVKAALAAAQDAAIATARAELPEAEVAERAGVSVSEVRRRITAHGKRAGTGRGPGRPSRTAAEPARNALS